MIKNMKTLDNVLKIKDVTTVVIGYLQSKNPDDEDPAITSLRGVLCLCDRTIGEILDETAEEIK